MHRQFRGIVRRPKTQGGVALLAILAASLPPLGQDPGDRLGRVVEANRADEVLERGLERLDVVELAGDLEEPDVLVVGNHGSQEAHLRLGRLRDFDAMRLNGVALAAQQ